MKYDGESSWGVCKIRKLPRAQYRPLFNSFVIVLYCVFYNKIYFTCDVCTYVYVGLASIEHVYY